MGRRTKPPKGKAEANPAAPTRRCSRGGAGHVDTTSIHLTTARDLGLTIPPALLQRAADLPVEQSSKGEWVVNQKTARILGVILPPALLVRVNVPSS